MLLVRVRHCGVVFLVPASNETLSDELVSKAVETYNQRLGLASTAMAAANTLFLRTEDGSFVPSGVPLHLLDTSKAAVYTLSKAHVQTRDQWVRLNVGGTIMHTARSTLCKDANSMLARMFGSHWPESHTDDSGAFMLDLDPKYFAPILNYLRTGSLVLDSGIARDGVLDCARFLQVGGVIAQLEQCEPRAAPAPRPYHVMILACRLASWTGLSGAVPKSVPQKFKFSATRKFGNQWELFSHSNELVALILNHLARMGWYVVTSSSGGAGSDITVYESYLLASTNDDVVLEDVDAVALTDGAKQ